MTELDEAYRVSQSSKDLAKDIVPKIEKKWNCLIDLDQKILGEAAAQASATLGHIGVEQPNHFKQAGHFGFWIRKLKPLRVIDLKNFQDLFCQLRDEDIITGRLNHIKYEPPASRCRFVNEVFGVLVAIGIIKSSEGTAPELTENDLHDLVANLRYHSFSPSAFAAILEARMPR